MVFLLAPLDIPDIVRDDVKEADSPLCALLIIVVKVIAEHSGCGRNCCGEKLHLHFVVSYDIIKLEYTSDFTNTFSMICEISGVVNSGQTSKAVPCSIGNLTVLLINKNATLFELHIYFVLHIFAYWFV